MPSMSKTKNSQPNHECDLKTVFPYHCVRSIRLDRQALRLLLNFSVRADHSGAVAMGAQT